MIYPCEFDQNQLICSGDAVLTSLFGNSNVSDPCDLENMVNVAKI